MPAVHAEALHHIIVTIAVYHLVQTGIGRAEFGIIHYLYPGLIFLARIEIIGATEIILRAGAVDGRKFRVAIHKEFDLPFAPPAVIVHFPGHVGAYIMSLSFYIIDHG